MKTVAWVLGLLALFGTTAQAAEEPLTLRDALQRAAKGNIDLQRERITIETNAANYLAARGQFDVNLAGNLTFSRRTTPPLAAGDLSGGFTNTLHLDTQVSRALETGGSIALSAQGNAYNTNSPFQCGLTAALPCNFYDSTLSLNFTHPLLRGFGSEIVQANLRKQRVTQDLGLLNRQARAANIIRDMVTMYWELAYSTQDLAIRRAAVDLAREQLRITRAQIEVGRLAPVDAAAVERAIADREQDVVVSEQLVFTRTLDLRRQLGLASDPDFPVFVAADIPTATPHDVDVRAEIQRALQSSPQLRSLKMGLKLNEIDIQTLQASLKPKLDFVGSLGSTGRKNSLIDTLAQASGLDDVTWSAGLSFQVPLENRAAIGQLQSGRLLAERARIDAADLELAIRDSAMRLGIAIHTASKRVELARETVTYAEKNLEAEKARFAVGRSTNNDVLLRQQELKAAQIQVVRATVDLLNSDVSLAALSGEILDQYGITLAGS